MRIHLIGTAGAGKTTLARQLAHRLALPHIELDTHYWQPQWRHRTQADFQRQYTAQLASAAWVVDGEYPEVNGQIWPKAELVIWLDYPLPLVLGRLLRRGLSAALTRHNLWGSDNYETLPHLFGAHSIFHRARSAHYRRRRYYAQLMRDPRYAHLRFLRFATPRATQQWLHTL